MLWNIFNWSHCNRNSCKIPVPAPLWSTRSLAPPNLPHQTNDSMSTGLCLFLTCRRVGHGIVSFFLQFFNSSFSNVLHPFLTTSTSGRTFQYLLVLSGGSPRLVAAKFVWINRNWDYVMVSWMIGTKHFVCHCNNNRGNFKLPMIIQIPWNFLISSSVTL